jgi:hypothetical protein
MKPQTAESHVVTDERRSIPAYFKWCNSREMIATRSHPSSHAIHEPMLLGSVSPVIRPAHWQAASTRLSSPLM